MSLLVLFFLKVQLTDKTEVPPRNKLKHAKVLSKIVKLVVS